MDNCSTTVGLHICVEVVYFGSDLVEKSKEIWGQCVVMAKAHFYIGNVSHVIFNLVIAEREVRHSNSVASS